MMYRLQQIAQILRAPIPAADAEIDTLLTDSRKPATPKSTLFFALDGPRRNGHLFIEELYHRGLRHFVVSQPADAGRYPGAVFIETADTLQALQTLAAHHRSRFTFPVIGITGSNGKTIVKEWLYQLRHEDQQIVRSPKSYNSQLGVPLSVWKMQPQDELAIFEAGISLPGEMEKLEKILRPTIGVLTNIGSAHGEGFASEEEKLQEKLKLFAQSEVFIANGDDPLIRQNVHRLSLPFFSWGKQEHNAVRIVSIDRQATRSSIILEYGADNFRIEIPFTDSASIENAITCSAVLLYLGVAPQMIAERMQQLQPVNMRLEYKKGINNCTIINDSYSADLSALSIALDFLQQQAKGQQKTVILSDFVENTGNPRRFYAGIARLLQQYGVNRLEGIGTDLQNMMPEIIAENGYDISASFYQNTTEYLRHFQSPRYKDEVILVKGARVFGFENIVSLLEQKAHQTILEINLDAIAHNFKTFQQLLRPQTKMMVMVKAFAYGSGGAEVAALLQYHKADYLGVAYADEGVELRQAGITLPVLVLNADTIAFDAITEYRLEPDIFSFELLDAFTRHLKNTGVKNYPVHIEVETGMNRLGFAASDIEQLGERLAGNKYVNVVSVFSHLVASEDACEDRFSLHQFEMLNRAADMLEGKTGKKFLRHIANSSGIARLPKLQLDMVRLGIGLYGVGATVANHALMPALTLKSTIAQIKHIAKGETVSYNRHGVATKDSTIATVRIGYADGYSRRFGNGVGLMLVHGQEAPVIGTVCMDMTMIDITTIAGVQEGDEVIVFGAQLPVEDIAQRIDAIPYEIMTGISQRVKRVYYGE